MVNQRLPIILLLNKVLYDGYLLYCMKLL